LQAIQRERITMVNETAETMQTREKRVSVRRERELGVIGREREREGVGPSRGEGVSFAAIRGTNRFEAV
jgi:hypothetical protein